jgi:hypothetical protein
MQQREYGLGLIYLLLGTVGLIGGLSYPLGTFSRMGAGYLPVAVSVIILGFAAASFVRGYARGEPLIPAINSASARQARSMLLLMAALLLFVIGCRSVGLFPSVTLLMLVAAMSSASFRFSPVALAGMLAIALGFSFIFVRFLGLPLPLIRLPI